VPVPNVLRGTREQLIDWSRAIGIALAVGHCEFEGIKVEVTR